MTCERCGSSRIEYEPDGSFYCLDCGYGETIEEWLENYEEQQFMMNNQDCLGCGATMPKKELVEGYCYKCAYSTSKLGKQGDVIKRKLERDSRLF